MTPRARSAEPPLALVGPTASGKSSLALDLAERFDAEIVSVDSMTVYRGMDVGTAKPSAADRARVPHHLLDVADPSDTFTVARFQQLARQAINDIRAREKRVLIVGGSGLYLRAAIDPLEFPPHDPGVRARLESLPAADLQDMLRTRDPAALAFVDLANPRRLVRALEVIEITGKQFSSFREAWEAYAPATIAGLRPSPDVLDVRIRTRIRQQLDEGFLEEVRRLLGQGFRETSTASQAIPYTQAVALIDGQIDEEAFLEEASRANRKLAKRQLSWFRADPRVRWFDADDLQIAAAEIQAYYEEATSGE